MKRKRLTFILGTRPEVIKLAPVILEAKRKKMAVKVVLTGQHRHMAMPLLKFFGLKPDLNLDVMSTNQSLTGLSGRLLAEMDKKSSKLDSDCIITQGDTTSAFIASYWAFCRKIPVAHVEAGLRTNQIQNPFPEEANRQLIGRIAEFHFAPTALAVAALRKENVPNVSIYRVGNTAIDALLFTLERLKISRKLPAEELLSQKIRNEIVGKKLVLVTAHRRESFGAPLEDICRGILSICNADPNIQMVYPVHPNPQVRQVVERRLGGHGQICLVEPLPYLAFVELMKESALILTDSGGVQEEAPTLRKPILVMRETSERPEGIKCGYAKLVGTEPKKIFREGIRALKNGCSGKGGNPYGDGKSAARIVKILRSSL